METDLVWTLSRALIAFAAGRGFEGEALPVAFPNVPFSRPASRGERDPQTHLAVSILRPEPRVMGINGWSVWSRLVQIDVLVRDGVGELPLTREVDALLDAFPVGHVFVGAAHEFLVTRPAFPASSLASSGWRFMPVTLPVQTIK